MFFRLVHVVKILKLETSAILNSVRNAHKVSRLFIIDDFLCADSK